MSSDSKSRSKRSRKKESKRAPRPGDLKPVDTSPPNDGRTDLLAVVLGMVSAFILIFGVFGLGSEEVVNKSYDRKQDLLRQKEIDSKRAATPGELAIQLADLAVSKSSNLVETLETCRSRIRVSNEIMKRGPKDAALRQLAITEGILAKVKLYGLDFMHNLSLEAEEINLEPAYTPYLNDEDPKVLRVASVARLTHRSFEKLKSGDKEVDDLVDLIDETMKRFSEDDASDESVASRIQAHLLVIVEKDTDYARLLFAKLRQRNPIGSLSPNMEQKLGNIADRLLLKSENFDRKFADRWANGRAGREDLADSITRLLENDGVGLVLVQRVLAVGHWFERNDFSDRAKDVYDALIASSANGNVAEQYRDDARQYATDGLTRLALKGKTIVYRGKDSAGKILDDAKLKEKIGIVVYWSMKSPASRKYLADLNASARALNNKPILIYAVCVDPQLPPDINIVMRKSPMIRIIDPIFESGKNSLLEQCPPGLLPHVMLVDFGGRVHDVNASDPPKVKNEALRLLMERARR